MQIEHQTVSLGRHSLHVVTAGSGVPVVLLHGCPKTWHEWRKVMPLLAGHFRLLVPLRTLTIVDVTIPGLGPDI